MHDCGLGLLLHTPASCSDLWLRESGHAYVQAARACAIQTDNCRETAPSFRPCGQTTCAVPDLAQDPCSRYRTSDLLWTRRAARACPPGFAGHRFVPPHRTRALSSLCLPLKSPAVFPVTRAGAPGLHHEYLLAGMRHVDGIDPGVILFVGQITQRQCCRA